MHAYFAIFPKSISFETPQFVQQMILSFSFSQNFLPYFNVCLAYLFLFQNQIYIFLTDKQNIICITLFAFFLAPSFRRKHKIAFLVSESYDVFMVKYSSLLSYLFHCLQIHMKYRDNELILRKTYIVPFMSAFLEAILNVADYYFSLW